MNLEKQPMPWSTKDEDLFFGLCLLHIQKGLSVSNAVKTVKKYKPFSRRSYNSLRSKYYAMLKINSNQKADIFIDIAYNYLQSITSIQTEYTPPKAIPVTKIKTSFLSKLRKFFTNLFK